MNRIRPTWIIMTIISSLLLSAGLTSAAERFDPQSRDVTIHELKPGENFASQPPCVVPCAEDYR